MADVEVALLTLLDEFGYTVTSTPGNLEAEIAEHGAVIRIRRVGGPGDRDNDFPRVSVQVMATASSAAPRAHITKADAIDDYLFAKIPGAYAEGVCFDEIGRDSGPVELTYPNPTVRVAESIYRLTTRR